MSYETQALTYANPLKAGRNVLEAAKKKGACFMDHQPVSKIERAADGNGYDVYTADDVIHAEKVLVACGIHAGIQRNLARL